MNDLKASNPGLQFSVTLPVLPTGLDNYGVGIVQAAANVGVKIDIVNIFRRPDAVPEVVDQAILLKVPAIWMQEDVIDGLENTPRALIGLLAGDNRGKRMIKV